MNGLIQVAVVATVSPLEVRLKGATQDSAVAKRTVANPSGLAIGQRVLVTIVDGQLTFLGRWDNA